MNQLKVGLVGASYVAATRVLPAMRAHDIAIGGLFDSEPERFDLWTNESIDVMTSDLDELLDADIDAVYISTRNEDHARHAVAAAQAGKHVLLEKPMALNLTDARELVTAAENAGVQLAVNHHLPGSPLHVTARRLVADGRIGTLLSARINHGVLLPENLRGWRIADTPGAGVVFDITVHDASVLNPLFGSEPVRVSAVGGSQASWNKGRSIDAVMTTIVYDPGLRGVPGLAQTHDAFCVPHPGTSMEIHGDQGAIVIGDAMTQDTPGTVTVVTADGAEPVDVDCGEDLYSINVAAFLAAIRGEGAPTATGADGVRALQVALAVEASLASGRAVDLSEL